MATLNIREPLAQAIGSLIGADEPVDVNFRPDIPEQPEPQQQPAVAYPGTNFPPESVEARPINDEVDYAKVSIPSTGDLGFDLGTDDDFILTTPSEESLAQAREGELERRAEQAVNGNLGLTRDPDVVESEYLQALKGVENGSKRGFTQGPDGRKVFMPIESVEGTGPDAKVFSNLEIGYGIKIMNKWLTDDPTNWPEVDGVRVDVRKGITEQQAERMMQNSVNKARDSASSTVPNFDKMTPGERQYWVDLTYNGGTGVVKKNPKATKAAKKGYTSESLIRTLDFIKGGGKPLRGLLRRRLNAYNNASVEITGLPAIDKYEWGKEIRVRFSAPVLTDRVSPALRRKINNNNGWYVVSKGAEEGGTYHVNDEFQF